MSGILLTANELATLLTLLSARQVIGVDSERLFPEESAELERLFQNGLTTLRLKGYVSGTLPQAAPDQGLMTVVATIADPDLVVFANRTEGGAQISALHYLGGDDIASLEWSNADQAYRLGWVDDRLMLARRVLKFLKASEAAPALEPFTLDEALFLGARDAARRGAQGDARSQLGPADLADGTQAALIPALAGDKGGELIVVRPHASQIEAGRRAWVLSGPHGAWIGFRHSTESTQMQFQPLSAATLSETINVFVEYLKPVTA
jgi:hypothetical protein